MDNANGDKEITSLLVNKYETLYSSVPTDNNERNQLHLIINEGLVSQQLQGNSIYYCSMYTTIKKEKETGTMGSHLTI